MQLQYFEDMNFEQLRNHLIFLDVDGCLLADNTDKLNEPTRNVINSLIKKNSLVLCTNSRNQIRNKQIEKFTMLLIVNKKNKKPSAKILSELELLNLPDDYLQLKKTVIGDKFLTDGRFAKNIGADFIKVRRKTGEDRLVIRFINMIDDLLFIIMK